MLCSCTGLSHYSEWMSVSKMVASLEGSHLQLKEQLWLPELMTILEEPFAAYLKYAMPWRHLQEKPWPQIDKKPIEETLRSRLWSVLWARPRCHSCLTQLSCVIIAPLCGCAPTFPYHHQLSPIEPHTIRTKGARHSHVLERCLYYYIYFSGHTGKSSRYLQNPRKPPLGGSRSLINDSHIRGCMGVVSFDAAGPELLPFYF